VQEGWKSEQEMNPRKAELRTWYKEIRWSGRVSGLRKSTGMGMRERTAWGEDY